MLKGLSVLAKPSAPSAIQLAKKAIREKTTAQKTTNIVEASVLERGEVVCAIRRARTTNATRG
jgi:hypothetical protein